MSPGEFSQLISRFFAVLAEALSLAVVGAVPLLAGLLDFCLFAPLFGSPLSGAEIRASK